MIDSEMPSQSHATPEGGMLPENGTGNLDRLPIEKKSYLPGKFLLLCLPIFLISLVLLFLGMDRRIDVYDEGLVLTNAMRVAAGLIPHRDFYANYGPAQFYVLAWLFDIFGRSVLAERLYDLILEASIVSLCYEILSPYCRRSVALFTAGICWLWLFSDGMTASPTVPSLLLILIASSLVLRALTKSQGNARLFAAGAVTGLTALFRYDVGAAVLLVHAISISTAALLQRSTLAARLKLAGFSLLPYAAGFTAVFLPVALLYLAVAPVRPFIHDMILYPSKYYARARGLPFPGLHWKTLDQLAVYLPLVVLGVVLFQWMVGLHLQKRDFAGLNGKGRTGFYILFGLLSAAMYLKGLVRIETAQMSLSIVPALLILALLFENALGDGRGTRIAVGSVMAFSLLTAAWSGLKEVRRVLVANQSSILQDLLSPPGPAAIRAETVWCAIPNALHRGMCFLVEPYQAQTISFVDSHTSPSESIFVGLAHHDKIYANNNLIYFAADRLPATKWSQFDPDLQSRADIQAQMIGELDSKAVRYLLLDREFDDIHEPNDSDKSSGVTLLDDYIRRQYRYVEAFDKIAVWQRR